MYLFLFLNYLTVYFQLLRKIILQYEMSIRSAKLRRPPIGALDFMQCNAVSYYENFIPLPHLGRQHS